MICWSCEKAVGAGAFCPSCNAVLPPSGDEDHFGVLGVGRGYTMDLGDLERRYKDAARRLHPDKFARADVRARKASLARSVALNQAWKTLRDPVRRAEYLLALAGIEVGSEEGTVKTKGGSGEKEKVPVASELLHEIMELREALMEARAEGDSARVERLTEDVRARRSHAMDVVAEAFEADPQKLDLAAAELVAVRYFDRFLEEVAPGRGAGGESQAGPPHG